MKRWAKNTLIGLGAVGLSIGAAEYASAQSSPASYWGKAYDRGATVEDGTVVRVYDTNGTGDGTVNTDDDQLIGEATTFTYNSENGWFDIDADTDDPATPEDEGAVTGANTYFRLVRTSDGKEDLAYTDADMTTHIVTHEELTTKEQNVYTDFATGVEPVGSNRGLKVYPNPFSSELFIEDPFLVGEKEFEVFDMAGRKVLEGRYQSGERISVDVDGMAGGIYFMRITSGENSVQTRVDVKKIIKR